MATKLGACPWRLWAAQVRSIARLELKKNFFNRRGIGIWVLSLMPVLVVGGHAIDEMRRAQINCNLEEDTRILAAIFQFYYLRIAIFFGTMGVFTWLVRGEMVESTLHYYLLSPVRRELVVIGKFIAGLFTSCAIFGIGVFTCFFLMYVHFGAVGRDYVFNGPGLGQLLAYLGITLLACCGFGSLFLALSLTFKNPAVPGGIMLGWETFSGVLPSILQKFSVTYYLKHLCPVNVPVEGFMALFTVVTEPVPTWAAVVGLLILVSAVLTFACWRMRTIEISYHTE
jgi:ABC-type transport system involved in multi-copper enzyme maturation permease subunit